MESRLSKHSPNVKIFKKSTQVHQVALKKPRIWPTKTYKQQKETKQSKRRIIWLNPPYSNNVLTKVGSHFLETIILQKHATAYKKHQCPLNEKYQSNDVLYKASITPNEENSKTKIYYGVSEAAFKLRYANHKKIQ